MASTLPSAVTVSAPSVATTAPVPAWRWVHLAIAALAMVATLPGRTHGLGLITEPLLVDLNLGRVTYGAINTWATLLGAAFCLPCGWLIDRLGIRLVMTTVLVALGGTVLLMSQLPRGAADDVSAAGAIVLPLFVLVFLTRGFGQSALSVVSLALMGKAAGRRSGFAVGVYSFLVAVGFMVAFTAIKFVSEQWEAEAMPALSTSTVGQIAAPLGTGWLPAVSGLAIQKAMVDWRTLWAAIGVALFACAIVSALLVRPSASTWAPPTANTAEAPAASGMTLGRALFTPTFWVFALAVSFYGLVAAGISLWNQSILEERGFERSVFLDITRLMPLIGLVSNLFTGWLATRWSMSRLLAVSMVILAASLAAFPFVESLWQVYAYAVAMGIAGGMITVLFFAIWGPAYGPLHLGKIQGAAQMLTVLASGLGPWLLASSKEQSGSYALLFQVGAAVSVLFAIAAWLTPVPNPEAHHA